MIIYAARVQTTTEVDDSLNAFVVLDRKTFEKLKSCATEKIFKELDK